MDFDTVVELTDSLRKKMNNSKLIDKANYSYMMKLFSKSERAENLNGRFKVKTFVKVCNCILNEFGFKIDSNRTQHKNKNIKYWTYYYSLCVNMINMLSILNKY